MWCFCDAGKGYRWRRCMALMAQVWKKDRDPSQLSHAIRHEDSQSKSGTVTCARKQCVLRQEGQNALLAGFRHAHPMRNPVIDTFGEACTRVFPLNSFPCTLKECTSRFDFGSRAGVHSPRTCPSVQSVDRQARKPHQNAPIGPINGPTATFGSERCGKGNQASGRSNIKTRSVNRFSSIN